MEEEFRPGFGQGLTVAIAVMAALSLVMIAFTAGIADAVLTLPWLALFVTGCWAVFWNPRVIVSDGGVKLVNVTRTIDVPWPALVDVETRFSLTLHTAYGRFAAWAAPAPGAGSALRGAMRDRRDASEGGAARVTGNSLGDIAGSSSGDAATIVRTRWERLRDAGHLADPKLEFERPPVRWHWQIGLVMLGLALLSLATLSAS